MYATSNARRTCLMLLMPVMLLALLMQVGSQSVAAQDDNLLANPSFEGDYSGWLPQYSTAQMAPNWTPWWLNDDNHDPVWAQPEYKKAEKRLYGERVLDGDSAQQYFTFYKSHYGGVLQQVGNVTPGMTYRFSIWAQVWSSVEDGSNSVLPADPNLQIGIDPTGDARPGVNNAPSTVVWGPPTDMNAYIDKWHQFSVDVTAENSTITVYVKSSPKYAVKHNDFYLDAASLTAVGMAEAPTPEPEPAPAQPAPVQPDPVQPAPSNQCPPIGAWPAGCVPGPAAPAQPCPNDGTWPRGCTPSGSSSPAPTPGGNTCPPTGRWPAGCTPGGPAPAQPCPNNGTWPRGCIPSGDPSPAPNPGDGAGQPCPTNGTWPRGCVPSDQPAPAPVDTTPSPAPAPAPSGGFGLGGQTQSFANPDLMKDVGMTWVKFQHKWGSSDTPDAVAGRIADAKAKGFKVLMSMPGADTNPSSIDFGGYVNFLRGVAALDPAPDAIEIWNEINIDFEWPLGEISPQSYFDNMLKPGYEAIKSQNPNIMVISGAPAPTGYFGGACNGNGCDDKPYMEELARLGAANYMDCIGIHYNEGIISPNQRSGDPRGNGGHYTRYFWGMTDAYYNAFGGSRPLCYTEIGFVSGEDYGGVPPRFAWAADTSISEHAQWLSEAVQLSRDSGKVRMFIVWNVDFTQYGDDPQAGYAMVRRDGSCPACNTIKAVMGR